VVWDWRRPPGRPHRIWLRTLEADLQPHNLGLNSAWRFSQDGGRWQHLVETARSSSGHARDDDDNSTYLRLSSVSASISAEQLGYTNFVHCTFYYPASGRGTGYCFRAISFFVSLLARLRENGWTDLHEIFREGVEWPDHGTTRFNFGPIRVNESAGRRSTGQVVCYLVRLWSSGSPVLTPSDWECNEIAVFGLSVRDSTGRGLLCPAPQLVYLYYIALIDQDVFQGTVMHYRIVSNHIPLSKHEAGDGGVSVVERVITDCPPGAVVEHFKTSRGVECTLRKSNLYSSWTNTVISLEQARKVLWTRKAPACLFTLLYAYGKPRLCINIHRYAPPL